MIVHSIISEERIFSQEDEIQEDLKEILMKDGAILETRPSSHNTYEVVRLISTNPSHYLNAEYSPGALITNPTPN